MSSMSQRFRSFLRVFDDRYEDLREGPVVRTIYRDFSAGLIVALTAIPMAMGFAIASGLRPEQGIVAGAVACIVGRTFGGSKYQVYGPTAAFIPLIAMIVGRYDHSFLVLVSIIAGVVLMTLGLLGLGRIAKLVPNSIVVGFTVGIAITIACSNLGEALGIDFKDLSFIDVNDEGLGPDYARLPLADIPGLLARVNWYALGLALATFATCRYLMRISVFIPAPLIAIALCTVLSNTLFAGRGITLVADRFGAIPSNFFAFTPPRIPEFRWPMVFDGVYFVLAITFISGVESLLCSSMADKMARNRGTPFNPDREFWGQGLVQIITPLLNGFPCTGALARTATSIKAGAVTPLAGYFKGVLKLMLAYFVAPYLELVPMSCIAGILFWVASNMIKPAEIREQLKLGLFPGALVVYTAVMVAATDFLTGVLSALILYAAGSYLKVLWRSLTGPAGDRINSVRVFRPSAASASLRSRDLGDAHGALIVLFFSLLALGWLSLLGGVRASLLAFTKLPASTGSAGATEDAGHPSSEIIRRQAREIEELRARLGKEE